MVVVVESILKNYVCLCREENVSAAHIKAMFSVALLCRFVDDRERLRGHDDALYCIMYAPHKTATIANISCWLIEHQTDDPACPYTIYKTIPHNHGKANSHCMSRAYASSRRTAVPSRRRRKSHTPRLGMSWYEMYIYIYIYIYIYCY